MGQSMQMAQQMFGQQGGAGMPGMFGQPVHQPIANQPQQVADGADATNTAAQATDATNGTAQPANQPSNSVTVPSGQVNATGVPPPTGNPMMDMMQAMMGQGGFGQNPMGMPGMFSQYPMGQPPMFGNFAPQNPAGGAMNEATLAAAASNPMIRARFAQQLEALFAMGFSDEQKCLQALVQTDGNVDRALDRLLSEN